LQNKKLITNCIFCAFYIVFSSSSSYCYYRPAERGKQ
jgi:hypothetical protein